MEIVIYITISILILDIALIKQRMLANIETSNPYHAQYILRHQVTGDTDDDRLAHSPADRMYTGKDHQKYTFCTK